jgi:hypothetical protein
MKKQMFFTLEKAKLGKKHKGLKLDGGQAYDHSVDQTAFVI